MRSLPEKNSRWEEARGRTTRATGIDRHGGTMAMQMERIRHFLTSAAAALFVTAAAAGTAGAADTHQVLYAFTGGNDGGNAASGVVFDSAGNGYGTTVVGGIFD